MKKLLLLIMITLLPVAAWCGDIVIQPWGTEQPWQMKYVQVDGLENDVPPANDAAGHVWWHPDYDDSTWGSLNGPVSNHETTGTGFNFGNDYYHWTEFSHLYLRGTFQVNQILQGGYYVIYGKVDDDATIWINGTEAKQTKQTAPKTKGKKNSQPTPEEPKTEVTENV